MKLKYKVVCIIALSTILIGCGGLPEANTTNCSGRGLEIALQAFDNEADRQAFIDQCEALAKE